MQTIKSMTSKNNGEMSMTIIEKKCVFATEGQGISAILEVSARTYIKFILV